MGSKRRSSRGEAGLTDRQRHWLKHIRAAEGRGEPLKHYAARKGLSAHSLYEAKRVLRERGVIAPAAARKRPRSPRFARVEVIGPRKETPVCSLRVRLASGAELEWSEAPSGEALRELVECLGR